MPTRVHVSTDAGSFGIWDAAEPAAGGTAATLEELAQQEKAGIIRMEGDCGGAADIFVDEDLPADVLAETTPLGDELTVVIRSGALVVDGVEYFGVEAARSERRACRLPNGTYRATVRVIGNEDQFDEPQSEKEIRRILGAANVDYYDRTNRNTLLISLSTFLLLPGFLFLMRWFVAVPLSVAIFIASFHVTEWVLKRNARYQELQNRIARMRLAGERPLLAIHLSRC